MATRPDEEAKELLIRSMKMKIRKHSSLLVADKVLASVRKRLAEITLKDVNVALQSYQNGREQGHALVAWHTPTVMYRWIAFCETWVSDKIVVYVDVTNPQQGVSDYAYDNANYFSPDYIDSAVDYIVEQISRLQL